MHLGKRSVLFPDIVSIVAVGVAIALVVVTDEFHFINCKSGKYHH